MINQELYDVESQLKKLWMSISTLDADYWTLGTFRSKAQGEATMRSVGKLKVRKCSRLSTLERACDIYFESEQIGTYTDSQREVYDGHALYREISRSAKIGPVRIDVKKTNERLPLPDGMLLDVLHKVGTVELENSAGAYGEDCFVISARVTETDKPDFLPEMSDEITEVRYFSKKTGVLLREDFFDCEGSNALFTVYGNIVLGSGASNELISYSPPAGVEVIDVP